MKKVLIAVGAVVVIAATMLMGVSTASAGWRHGWGYRGWDYAGWRHGWGYGGYGNGYGYGVGYVAPAAPVARYVYYPTAYYHYRNYGYYPYNYAAYPVHSGYWGSCGC